jgi:hypothetical protein
MDQSKHDDPRSDDQKVGERESQGPRDSEHRDGARKGEALNKAVEKQAEQEARDRTHPAQPEQPPAR